MLTVKCQEFFVIWEEHYVFLLKECRLSQIQEDFHQDGKKHVFDNKTPAKFKRKGAKAFSLQNETPIF